MKQRILKSAIIVTLAALLALPAAAQQTAQKPEPPAPITRAQKANKMFTDAHSLMLTGRPLEGAALYESLVKTYPTSEKVPEALARAANIYFSAGDDAKAAQLLAVFRKNFDTSQFAIDTYWAPCAKACGRDSKTPAAERVALLEDYLDRYWAQKNFGEAIEWLSASLIANKQTEDADALLSHALAETPDEGLGGMINLIQRGIGGRKDYAAQAKVWGDAARDMDQTAPAYPVVVLLEVNCLVAAEQYDDAAKAVDALIKDRPKSEYAAYAALQVKPGILARQKKPAEAAEALKDAIQTFSIFALPRHTEQLADYHADAGDFQSAVKAVDQLLGQPQWPFRKLELLNKKHDLLVKQEKFDEANAVNEEIAAAFPDTRTAVSARLRSVGNLLAAKRSDDAQAAMAKVIETCKGTTGVTDWMLAWVNRFGDENAAPANTLREQLIAAFPASAEADVARKALKQAVEGQPTAKAAELFKEYQSFAQESNVDAARRRIDRLFAEFPTSEKGPAAAVELGDALRKADKVELAAELYMLLADKAPCNALVENRLEEAGKAYNGVAKPAEAFAPYSKLAENFRYSRSWENYVQAAAGTLFAQDKLSEAESLLSKASQSIGRGVQGLDLEAQVVRRLEGQEKWAEAAQGMLKLLGSRAADPQYRGLTGEAFRFLVVSGDRNGEAKLLEDLANKYEGWDEADRIRISLAGTYARDKQAQKAVKLLEEIQKRHPKYDIGASGAGMLQHLSKWSRALFTGTVGYQPVDRVAQDMSGGYGNYLYAHRAEDMIDYTLLLNEPQAYVDRVKKRIGELVKEARKRPAGYKSGLPYKTKNVPRPRTHPLPEQRRIYGMVNALDAGMRQMNKRVDPALWLEVYPLWPNYYLNDERILAAARALYGRDKNVLFNKAVAILKSNYNDLTWAPYVLYTQARWEQTEGSPSKAAQMYQQLATRYPDHELAPGAADSAKQLSGRR